MKNQSGTIKTNLELDRVVMEGSGGYRRLPGGSDHFSLQTHRQTLIIIYISSLSSYSSLTSSLTFVQLSCIRYNIYCAGLTKVWKKTWNVLSTLSLASFHASGAPCVATSSASREQSNKKNLIMAEQRYTLFFCRCKLCGNEFWNIIEHRSQCRCAICTITCLSEGEKPPFEECIRN